MKAPHIMIGVCWEIELLPIMTRNNLNYPQKRCRKGVPDFVYGNSLTAVENLLAFPVAESGKRA